jgi:DNA-binding protein H-NS
MVANMARAPKGGDTDQIKAVASGECARGADEQLLPRTHDALTPGPGRPRRDRKVGVVFPNQADHGTHVNVAGGAVARHAKHRDAAASSSNTSPVDRGARLFCRRQQRMAGGRDTKLSNPGAGGTGQFQGRKRADLGHRHEPDQGSADTRSGGIQVTIDACRSPGLRPHLVYSRGFQNSLESPMANRLSDLLAKKAELEQQIIDIQREERSLGHCAGQGADVSAWADAGRPGTRAPAAAKAPAAAARSRPSTATRHRQTWSGRGLHPTWLKQALAGGAKLTDYLI